MACQKFGINIRNLIKIDAERRLRQFLEDFSEKKLQIRDFFQKLVTKTILYGQAA
jgi:hypothetical protein